MMVCIRARSEICGAQYELDEGRLKPLTRETAFKYIRKHLAIYDELLLDEMRGCAGDGAKG
jgi:hypothetical protein